jgi:hypothetical protein
MTTEKTNKQPNQPKLNFDRRQHDDAAELQRHHDTVGSGRRRGVHSAKEGVVPEVHQLQAEARERRKRSSRMIFNYCNSLKLNLQILLYTL